MNNINEKIRTFLKEHTDNYKTGTNLLVWDENNITKDNVKKNIDFLKKYGNVSFDDSGAFVYQDEDTNEIMYAGDEGALTWNELYHNQNLVTITLEFSAKDINKFEEAVKYIYMLRGDVLGDVIIFVYNGKEYDNATWDDVENAFQK